MIKIHGSISIADQHGNVLAEHNIVVNTGLGIVRKLLAGQLYNPEVAIKFGNGTDPMASSNSSIANPVATEILSKAVSVEDFKAEYEYHLPFNSGNELTQLTEMGLFLDDEMMSRVKFEQPYAKTIDIAYTGKWALQITAHPDDLVYIVDDDGLTSVVSDDGADLIVDLVKAN